MTFNPNEVAYRLLLEKALDKLICKVQIMEQEKIYALKNYTRVPISDLEWYVADAKESALKLAMQLVDKEARKLIQYKNEITEWVHEKYNEGDEE